MAAPLSPVLDCTEFVAVEGRYELLKDIFLDQVLPHSVITTHVSSVAVKYKDYLNAGNGAKSHGKQVSSDSTASNLDGLEERLKDIKLRDDRGDEDDNDDSPSGYKSPRSGIMSPGLPPSQKDAASFGRLSDPYTQFGPPPPMPQQHQQQQGSKALSRANSYYSQGGEENGSSSATGSTSAGFSSFFGGGKRKKPKNNITKTNSTFVAKITTHENLAKILAGRTGEDVYLFWNTGRTFTWSDLGQKPNEPLSHISFSKAFPTSHDVNILTRSCDHLDVIIGFSTGDIMWFDPPCNKYFRLNKQAIIKDSAVTMIKWMPGSESQFMVAFHDGSILIMDKERDDNAFSAPVPPSDNVFHVTRPKHNKHNPVSHWQVSSKPITAFAFSPDLQHVAVVSMDGCLRIIDFRNERLLDTFSSYFGALKCVSWSPDGKYILTGGQDDLVTIWSFRDQKIVARCQGHQSYVTGVAFDPWRCDERNYRFGSVGEDAKLLLWDFSVGALHKPKAAAARRGSTATVQGAAGGSSGYKPGHKSKGSISSLRGNGGHSLFSGHHKGIASGAEMSQPGVSAGAHPHPHPHHHFHHLHHQHRQTTPAIAEESALEQTGNGDSQAHDFQSGASTVSSQLHHPARTGESISFDENSTVSSTYSSTLVSESGRSRAISMSATTAASNDAGSSNAVYKKSAHARTLPHLHLHKPHEDNGKNDHYHHDHGISSLMRNGNGINGVQIVRPPEPRSHVAMLQPMMAKNVHVEPLSGITFREDAIMTSDRRGHIRVWKRPPLLPHP